MQISKGCPDKSVRMKIALRIDKPQNMKHAGLLTTAVMRPLTITVVVLKQVLLKVI